MSKENVEVNKMTVRLKNNGMEFSEIQRTVYDSLGVWLTEQAYRLKYKKYKNKYEIQNKTNS